ncbi:MAG: hypothetical protein L0154_00120 [Chloroflexi bacterium]|nr:hypothetical protein [Chloroflexota bacterium]
MSTAKDELKARLLAEAEASIDRMLADDRMGKQMTISEIEDVIGDLEMDFRERVLSEVMGEQESQTLSCPECGGNLRHKGRRSKQLTTWRGETELDRNYYQCETCGQGVFPPR